MNKNYKDIIWLSLLWTIFAGALISVAFYLYNRTFVKDEFEHIHTAWKILQGQEFYIDFFEHHHPFFNYLIALVLYTFGSTVKSILISRYVILFMTVCILAVTYLLSRLVFKNAEIGVVSVILTSTVPTFYISSTEIRPDVLQTLTGLLSIYFLFVYYDKKSFGALIASSAFLALSFLVLQKSIVLIISIGAFLLYDLYKKRLRLNIAALYAAVFLICVLPYYIYLLSNGSFGQYFVTNWLMNYHMPQQFGKLKILLMTFRESTITFVLYFIGALTLIISGRDRRFAILSLCLLILPMVMFKNLWRQYYMPAIPLVGIIASYALYSFFNTRWSRFIVLMGAIYLPIWFIQDNGFFDMNNKGQSNQLQKIEYVLSITDEDDKVYDGDAQFNVFRDDVDYFWFCRVCRIAYQKVTDYEYNIYGSISAQKPKVISTNHIPSFNDIRIKYDYKVSEKYPDLLIRKD
jgi:hypothetical protein